MRAHPGVAQTMFRTLSEKGINIQVISTSEIKVSVLIDEEYVELAVRALHSAYELDAAEVAGRPDTLGDSPIPRNGFRGTSAMGRHVGD